MTKPLKRAARETMLANRWQRKGNGRIPRGTARDLARRQLAGCMGGTDFLVRRSVAREWANMKQWPARVQAQAVASMRRFAVDKFFHYGPRFARWPGEPAG